MRAEGAEMGLDSRRGWKIQFNVKRLNITGIKIACKHSKCVERGKKEIKEIT